MSNQVKVQSLNRESNELLCNFYKPYKPIGFSRFGDAGYILPSQYEKHANAIKSVQVRPEDIWVTTHPRSGTTWTQELVWLLRNDCDFESASKIPLTRRYYFIENYAMLSEAKQAIMPMSDGPEYKSIEKAPSPRFIKTHLPLSLIPADVLDTAKVIYVARDPRDVAVSFYHYNKLFKMIDAESEFKEFWSLFVRGLLTCSPYINHVKEAWAKRNHPNMLFIFYEEMIQDLPSIIRRIAAFLGKEITQDQIEKLCEHLNINNFRNNESVNPLWRRNPEVVNVKAEPFIRKGKIGDWQNHFDVEMTAQAESWLRQNLADTDLKFPSIHLNN